MLFIFIEKLKWGWGGGGFFNFFKVFRKKNVEWCKLDVNCL